MALFFRRAHLDNIMAPETVFRKLRKVFGNLWTPSDMIGSSSGLRKSWLFKLDYEYEYDFSILVFRLHIITTHPGGGVLPIMAYTGSSARKGYLFQASGIKKGRDFTTSGI